jgi:molecular chaperone DnaK (HSP70)
MNESESRPDFIISIDFGTTYTGVAFTRVNDDHGGDKKPDLASVVEKIEIFKAWPNQTQYYAEKIPTVLAYNTDPPKWGQSVRPQDEPQIAHFKLGLQARIVEHYGKAQAASTLAFLDPHWKNPVPNKNPVDFAADFLESVHQYIKDVALPRQYGKTFLKGLQIAYVITVPAIWNDGAKALTRQAAERAGIPRNRLELVTEPEAAALYCATICEEVDLGDGDRFMVCDAGGGTVVLPRLHSTLTRSRI